MGTGGFFIFILVIFMTTFASIGVRQDILDGLASLGFKQPTPIQERIIPLMLEKRRDIVGLAQTGTGKTAAFGIPLVQLAACHEQRPGGLVLCPTRELCIQVTRDMESMARRVHGVNILAIYGGDSMERQIRALKKGVHIIVATPGRLNDLVNRRKVNISAVQNVVFDEADEMLKMGFQDELNAILAKTPEEKNTLLFSATMSPEIRSVAGRYMKDPAEVTIGRPNACSENVTHEYYVVNSKNRYPVLKRVVDNSPGIYSIVFCRTRHETSTVASKLARDGYGADSLHGDMSQGQREQVMRKFRERQIQILVATDVAARGLDVNDLTHVINYNLPDDIAAYTHRSGRTGRAGRAGVSVVLAGGRESSRIRRFEKGMKKKFIRRAIPDGADICRRQLLRFADELAESGSSHPLSHILAEEISDRLAHLDREELLRRIVSMRLENLLEYYGKDSLEPKPKPPLCRKPASSGKTGWKKKASGRKRPVRFHIDAGKRSGVMPQAIMGQINQKAGNERIRLNRIEIMRNSTILEADGRHASTILAAFRNCRFNGKPVSIAIAADREKRKRTGKRKTENITRDRYRVA